MQIESKEDRHRNGCLLLAADVGHVLVAAYDERTCSQLREASISCFVNMAVSMVSCCISQNVF